MEEAITIHSVGGVEVELPVAGLGGRSLAFIIDIHIRVIFAMAWGFGVGWFLNEVGIKGDWIGWLAVLPALLIYFLYHPLLEWLMGGRTPGKRMMGLRIVTEQGLTPGLGAILVRNIFRLIDSMPSAYVLGLVVAHFSARHARIGDIAAGTLITYEEALKLKALEGLFDEPGESGEALSLKQRELLMELLERWNGLLPERRHAMALTLLRARGLEPPAKGLKYDGRLRTTLKGLLEGGEHE